MNISRLSRKKPKADKDCGQGSEGDEDSFGGMVDIGLNAADTGRNISGCEPFPDCAASKHTLANLSVVSCIGTPAGIIER